MGRVYRALSIACLLAAVGCAAPYSSPFPYASPAPPVGGAPPVASAPPSSRGPAISYVNLKSLPQTVGVEHRDRMNRLQRLSAIYGSKPPRIDELQLNPGTLPDFDYPLPVVRILFDERVFFDFNKDTIRPEARPVLDIMADNMRRDVPDAQLLVLGHTDAIGTDVYNIDLSRRRALSVMRELIARGVRSSQLATVAIGKSQPVAPNDTEEGRALNRRVEFMISASQEANLMLVRKRRIDVDYLRVTPNEPPARAVVQTVEVLRPQPIVPQARIPSDTAPIAATPSAPVTAKPQNVQVSLQPVGRIELQQPTTVRPELRQVIEPQERQLDSEFAL